MSTRTTPNLTDDVVSHNENKDLVFDNLGLTSDDIGLNTDLGEDFQLDADNGDDGDGADISEQHERSDNQRDDVTHNNRTQRRQESQRHTQEEDQVLHHRAEVRADSRGNLVNERGVVVARAGKEARLYQQAHNAQVKVTEAENAAREIGQRFNELAGHARGLLTEVQEHRARNAEWEKVGLKPDEQLKAAQLYVEIRDKPELAMRKLLTRAAATGIDVTKLGLEPGGFNPKDLVEMLKGEISTVLTPVTQRTELERRREEAAARDQDIRAKATNEVETFLRTNPDATKFLPAIQQLLSQPAFAKMSLDQIWDKIQLNLLRNGQRPGSQQRRPLNSRGMPSGRGAPTGGDIDRHREELAPVDMDYGDILKDILGNEQITT